MQIIINTDNNITVINSGQESATIVDNKLMFNGIEKALTTDQIASLTSAIRTASQLTSSIFGKKKTVKITYTNGVFTIVDNKSDLKIFFETDLTTEQKVQTDAFKVIAESWVNEFKTINFTAPNLIGVDSVIKNFKDLPEEEQIVIGAVGEIMTAIINE